MALIKTPDGGWLVDDEEFIVNYEDNYIKLKNNGSGTNLPTPTTEDEGKFLVVIDGQYKLVDIATIKG